MAKKIMIVDDDPDARFYYTSILEDLNVEFFEAEDGEAGMQKIRQIKPDLVLLDLMMPRKGGLKVFNELKEDRFLQNIPVIMISGASKATGVDMKQYVYDRPFHEKKVAVTGKRIQTVPVEYIEKPVEPSHLLNLAKTILGL